MLTRGGEVTEVDAGAITHRGPKRSIRQLPPTNRGDEGWHQHAACSGHDTDTFYRRDNARGPERDRHDAQAKAVCAGCPVSAPCLRWALAIRERHGVWGGYTPEERDLLLRAENER
jgi:WhiB family redox-sensing transcriptional regulator